MNSLSCGERLVRCLAGGDIDRVPFGISFGWHPWPATLEKWREQTGRLDLDPASEFGYEPGFACPALESGPFPRFEHSIISEDATHVVYRDWRGITMRQLKTGTSMPEFLDYPVKTPDDWERLRDTRYRLQDTDQRVTQDWNLFRNRLSGTGEAVQVGAFPWGVFGTVRDLLGTEEMLVSFYTAPGMIRDMMDRLTSIWIGTWERVAANVRIDHIHIWEDMSGRQGSLISPAMVREFMMPCYDRISEFARSNKVRIVSVDTDGDCSELVPLMMQHGINMFLPFEVQAGNDIREYRRKYPELGIMGGLDKRCLAISVEAVEQEAEKCAEMIRYGRYIPCFDHQIPPDADWTLFSHAARRIKNICHCGMN